MATKRFTGYLREPLSEYAQHDLWRFTHATTTGEVVKGSTSMFKVDEEGYYDIEIQYGTVMIESKDRLSQRWINHGQYTISSATTVTTLPALLLATTPMTPDLQQELEAILADAQEARDQTVALFDSVDGDFIYHNKNVVGSVSATGSYPNLVPTGAIVESGSNANGSYIKFADGTAIAHGNINGLIVIPAGDLGSLGSPPSPVSFVGVFRRQYLASLHRLQAEGAAANTSLNTLNGSQRSANTGRPDECVVKNEGNQASTGYSLYFFYIGRWK